MADEYTGRVLAIYPASCGYGFALFDTTAMPIEWGVRWVKTGRASLNTSSLNKVLEHFGKFSPDFVVLEKFCSRSRRSDRVRELCAAIAQVSVHRKVIVGRYSKAEVAEVFVSDAEATKYEVAQAVANRFPALKHRLPEKWASWEPEPWVMTMFVAVALGVVFFERLAES